MARYEYVCERGHTHDLWATLGQQPVKRPCPECGAPAWQRWAGKSVAFTRTPTGSGKRRD